MDRKSPADWIITPPLAALGQGGRAALAALPVQDLPRGAVIFRPGDSAQAFPVVLSGRIDVFLTGPSGREILLYSVDPGQSCVQTTLGLMGDDSYAGEAVAAVDCRAVLIPRTLFLRLMEDEAGFRAFVFRAFAERMQSMMHVLEKVAFQRVESRLAQELLDLARLAGGDGIHATHAELAVRIGSAREVVSRRLEGFARRGWVETDRGLVRLTDRAALQRQADLDGPA